MQHYILYSLDLQTKQAKAVSETIAEKFLYQGGLVTTTKETGQQWDLPNAWAPYQWLGFLGMKNYGYTQLADTIKNNWSTNVERVYNNTGKLMEKYNALDTKTIAGGGEYLIRMDLAGQTAFI